MQGIPHPVKNVTVWPYIDWPPHSGIGPVIIPVIENASGTYTVGTLFTDVFYNLDLEGADLKSPLHPGGKYTASVTYEESGSTVFTPWMTCTNSSTDAKFGRTKSLTDPTADTPAVLPVGASTEVGESDLIHLQDLTDIGVAQIPPPPLNIARQVITGATGYQVATRVGTPHKMGVAINDPDSVFSVGMANLSFGSKSVKTGDFVSMANLTCVSAGAVAILLQTFP